MIMRFNKLVELVAAHYKGNEEEFQKILNDIKELERLQGNDSNIKSLEAAMKGKTVVNNTIKEKFIASSGTYKIANQIIPPKDKNSGMELYKVIYPNEIDIPKIHLSYEIEEKINSIKEEYENKEILYSHNLEFENRILLSGPPGCGKTTLAYHISKILDLPIAYLRLDTLISSLLGQTGNNLRKIFDSVQEKKMILFFDEFDAVAKKRDDQHELGELKRIVNSLLQNLDHLSNDVFVVAATNHEDILDKAIWRRFNSTIYLDLPDEKLRTVYLNYSIKNFDFNDSSLDYKRLAKVTTGMNYSEIDEIVKKVIKYNLLNKKTDLETEDFLENLLKYLYRYNTEQKSINVKQMKSLKERGFTNTELSKLLKIPRTTLIDKLKKEDEYL